MFPCFVIWHVIKETHEKDKINKCVHSPDTRHVKPLKKLNNSQTVERTLCIRTRPKTSIK